MAYLDRPLGWGLRAPASLAVAAVHAGLGYALVAGLPGVAMESIRERTLTGISLNARPHGGDAASSEGVPEGVIVQKPESPAPVAPTPGPVDLAEHRSIGCYHFFDYALHEPLSYEDLFAWPEVRAFPAVRPTPANDPSTWIRPEEIDALNGHLVDDWMKYSVLVGADGAIAGCTTVRSSNSRVIDGAICRVIIERARFEPARDEAGNPVIGIFSGTVRWETPDPPT